MTQGLYITHKKEQFSLAYIQAIATYSGCNIGKYNVDDDSVDILLAKRNIVGKVLDTAELNIQLKCTEYFFGKDGCMHYPLPIKNYNDLRLRSASPRILVVLQIPTDYNKWLKQGKNFLLLRHCAYWANIKDLEDSKNTTSVTVKIYQHNMFTPELLCSMMEKIADGENICS